LSSNKGLKANTCNVIICTVLVCDINTAVVVRPLSYLVDSTQSCINIKLFYL
jgi:hypothetical protein